jgi:two-component system, NarL family, nitrate/nitrite response regulator NarL
MAPERNALLVEPNQLFRAGLKQLLEARGVKVVGDGSSFAEAISQSDTGQLNVAICSFYNVRYQTEDCRNFKKIYPLTKLIILSHDSESDGATESAALGADAYLPNHMHAEELQLCVGLVLKGIQLFPAACAINQGNHCKSALDDAQDYDVSETVAHSRSAEVIFTSLSMREQQILTHLVSGWSNKLIARELDIAEATVKVHVKRLMRRARAINRTQIVIWALGHRLIVPAQVGE